MIRTPPDVIVLEWILRDWGSVEVLHQAIAQPTRIPVIVNTRYQPAQQDYFAYLADRFLIKSSDIAPLLRAIRDCLPECYRESIEIPLDPSRFPRDTRLLTSGTA
jgi:DNA-binding NarL/FixJ family response regulator